MELNILTEEKNTIELEIKGEGHTFCNFLRRQLWNDKDVEYAAYSIKHPQVSEPVFILKTKEEKPRKVLQKAIDDAKEMLKEFEKEVEKIK